MKRSHAAAMAAFSSSASAPTRIHLVSRFGIYAPIRRLDGRGHRSTTRRRPAKPDVAAINVMTFIEAVDKKVPTFRKAYDALCEYAHSNWSGTALLFSKNDREKVLTELGRNPRNNEFVPKMGLNSLIGSLIAFENACNQIGDALPAVIELCEADINTRKG